MALSLLVVAAALAGLVLGLVQAANAIEKSGWDETSGLVADEAVRYRWVQGDQAGFFVTHQQGEAFVPSAAEFTRAVLDVLLLNSDPSDTLAVGDAVTIYLNPTRPFVTLEEAGLAGPQPIPNASFTPWWLNAVRAVMLFAVSAAGSAGGRRLRKISVDRHHNLLTLPRREDPPEHAFAVSRLESRSAVPAMLRLYAEHLDYERPGIFRIRQLKVPYDSVARTNLRRSVPPTRRLTLELVTGETIHIDGLPHSDAERARQVVTERCRR